MQPVKPRINKLNRIQAMAAASVGTLRRIWEEARSTRRSYPLRDFMLETGRSTSLKDLGENTMGDAGKNDIRINSRLSLGLAARNQVKETVAHEVAHLWGLGLNHHATANALTFYLKGIHDKGWINNPGEKPNIDYKEVKDIESAYEKETAEKARRSMGHPVEYGEPLDGKRPSFAMAGGKLGLLDAKLEFFLKKPGIGIFFIKEVTTGVPVVKALEVTQRGQFDARLKDMLENDPYFKRLVTRSLLFKN